MYSSYLGLIATGKIQTEPLTVHRDDFDKALDAYGKWELIWWGL